MMMRLFGCLAGLFIFANNTFAQSQVCGIDDSGNQLNIVSFDCVTATTNTVLNISPMVGNISINEYEASNDVFNNRYFFSATNSQGISFYTVNLDSMNVVISPTVASAGSDMIDMEYDPFFNRILYRTGNALFSYDLSSSIVNTVCALPQAYSLILGSNRTFDPINQQYYYLWGDINLNTRGILVDVLAGDTILTLPEVAENKMMVFDFTGMQYYRFEQGSIASFDPFTGQSTPITTVPGLAGFLNDEMGMMDYPSHTYLLPYITGGFANKIASVDVSGQTVTSNQNFNSSYLTKLFPQGCRPLIRYNSPTELMCTYGSSYQWYHNGVPVNGANSQTYTVNDGGDYFAEVGSFNGNYANTDTVSFIVTGITKNNKLNKLQISPNPFTDQTILHLPSAQRNPQIEITDLSGRMIRSIKTESNSTVILKRENLLPGIYLIKVLINSHEFYTQKLVVAAE